MTEIAEVEPVTLHAFEGAGQECATCGRAPLDSIHVMPRGTADSADEVMETFKAGTDLVERRVESLPAVERWQMMESMARMLARSELMPKHIKETRDREAAIMQILILANDLGLNTTTALNKVFVIDGKPGMSAELMRDLVVRDGHDIWREVRRDENGAAQAVTWFGIRKDHPERVHEATFSLVDAVTAKLCSVNADGDVVARSSGGKVLPWEAFTEDMLSARATSRLCRQFFGDCLAGVSYTPEELRVAPAEVIDVPEPADEAELAAMRAEILTFSDEVKAEVASRWKEARLGSLQPNARMRPLSAVEVNAAWLLLREAERDTPSEAEIVAEDAPPGVPSATGEGDGQQADNSVQGFSDDGSDVGPSDAGVPSLTPAIGDAAVPSPAVGGKMTGTYNTRTAETVLLPGDVAVNVVNALADRMNDEQIAEIRERVAAMSPDERKAALREIAAPVSGTADQQRDRLIAWLVAELPF